MDREAVNRGLTKGAAWMIGMRLCTSTIGLISTFILARLLQPADFGLVALATALVAAFDLLTNFRFDTPLIQNQVATREDYDTAWTLNLTMGTTLALLLCLAAHPAAQFFEEPRLSGVVFALAAVGIIDGAQNIGIVNFRKEFAFAREFVFATGRKVASFGVGIGCAWLFRSYWALTAGIVASSVWGLVASYVMHPYRPRFSTRSARTLFDFSKWLVLDNVIQFLRFRSSDFLIGKLAGMGAVGLFNIASEVATLPQNTLTAPINRALLPGYARLATDKAALRDTYLAVIGMTTFTAVPAATGIAAIAPLMVPLALGDHWLPAIPLMQLLGVASAVALTGTGASVVYLALGRPMLVVALGGLHVTVMLGAMAFLFPRLGLVGAAWAMIAAATASVPAQMLLVQRVLGPVLRGWLAVVWRPTLAALLMFLAVSAYVNVSVTAAKPGELLSETLLGVLLGVCVYVAVVAVTWLAAGRPAGAERRMFEFIRDFRVQ
jgi:O-antigen/teichoic acid export membrane protein